MSHLGADSRRWPLHLIILYLIYLVTGFLAVSFCCWWRTVAYYYFTRHSSVLTGYSFASCCCWLDP